MRSSRLLQLAALLICSSFSTSLQADTIQVPAEQPTVQAAANAAAIGDVVLIAKGVYTESVTLAGKSGITFRGQGKVIFMPSDGEGGAPAFDVTFSARLAFESLEFEGFDTALDLSQSSRMAVRDCKFRNCVTAVRFNELDQSLVRDCRIDDTSVGLRLTECTSIVASGNRFNVTGAGINLIDGSQLILRNNKLFGGAFGVLFGGTPSQVELLGNQVRDAINIGFSIAGDNHTVQGNVLRKCNTGIRTSFGLAHTQNTFIENKVLQSTADGLFIRASQSRVIGNVVKKAGGEGLVADGQGTLVLGNVISATGGAGIRAAGNGGSFIGNRVKKSGATEIMVEGTGNFFEGNKPATPFDV